MRTPRGWCAALQRILQLRKVLMCWIYRKSLTYNHNWDWDFCHKVVNWVKLNFTTISMPIVKKNHGVVKWIQFPQCCCISQSPDCSTRQPWAKASALMLQFNESGPFDLPTSLKELLFKCTEGLLTCPQSSWIKQPPSMGCWVDIPLTSNWWRWRRVLSWHWNPHRWNVSIVPCK